jgi:hypothetical protein
MSGKVEKKKRLLTDIQKRLEERTGLAYSLNEVIIMLCEEYLKDIKLSDTMTRKIVRAADSAKMSPLQILGKACDWAEKFYYSRYLERPSDPSKPGSAYLRIDQFVKKLIKKNDSSKKKEDKVFINQTYLIKHQGSNRGAVKGYLEINKDILTKHHKKHGLHSRHNIEVHSYLFARKN